MENDILDLDALVPPSRKIKLNNKLYDVKPLTIKQLIILAKLEQRLTQVQNEDEIMPEIKKALSPVIPDIDDENIDFTPAQMKAIIRFAQQISVEEAQKDEITKDYSDTKKKQSSQEE